MRSRFRKAKETRSEKRGYWLLCTYLAPTTAFPLPEETRGAGVLETQPVKGAGEAQGGRGETGKSSGEESWEWGQEVIPKAIRSWLLKTLEPVTALFVFKKIYFFEQSIPVAQ